MLAELFAGARIVFNCYDRRRNSRNGVIVMNMSSYSLLGRMRGQAA